MAVPTTTIAQTWTTGSSTNGGLFSRTGTMDATGSATAANTASPIFSSLNYSFQSTDINAWLYIKSGASCVPGWYQIVSVAAGAATLSAAVGAAVMDENLTSSPTTPIQPTTTIGIASVASPNTITWAIDYSQQASAQVSVANASTNGTTTITSATAGFTVAMVGNGFYLNGGAGAVPTQWRTIASFTNSTTVVMDTLVSQTSTGDVTLHLGGALNIGQTINTSEAVIGSMTTAIKATAAHAITTGLTTLAGSSGAPTRIFGYTSLMGDGGQATIQISSGNSGVTMLTMAAWADVRNIILDANSQTTSKCLATTGSPSAGLVSKITVKNFTSQGAAFTGASWSVDRLVATGSGSGASSAISTTATVHFDLCVAYSNQCPGFLITENGGNVTLNHCRSYANSGASSDGFQISNVSSGPAVLINCVSYNNGRDGLRMTNATSNYGTRIENCGFINNASGIGINSTTTAINGNLHFNNAFFGNSSNYAKVQAGQGDITNPTLTGDPFVSGSTGNFALNNTAGAGALLRAAGWPGSNDPLGLTVDHTDIGPAQHADPVTTAGLPPQPLIANQLIYID